VDDSLLALNKGSKVEQSGMLLIKGANPFVHPLSTQIFVRELINNFS